MATILVVDDDADVRWFLGMVLQKAGYRLLEADDGAQGLHSVRTEHPDLVIADLLMPTMSGYELVRQIRTDPRFSRTPVILITGVFHGEEGRRLAAACGVYQLIAKPFGRDEIIRVVAEALSSPPGQAVLSEDLQREHLQFLTNTLVAKVSELGTANRRLEQRLAQLKRAEQALRESHALLHAVVEAIPEAVFVKDDQSRYLLCNSSGARIVGKAVEAMIGLDDAALFSPETAQRFRETDRRVMERQQVETYEESGTTGGVSRRYLTTKAPYRDSNGDIRGIIGISRDVTESRAVQAERDRLLERLRLQIDRLPLAYILLDRDIRVLDWNPAAERVFGYTREEAVGRDVRDLIVDLPLDDRLNEVLRRIRAGDMQASSVNQNRTKDGRRITCEWFNTPLMTTAGEFIGNISLAQDITERMRVEKELADSRQQRMRLSQQLIEAQEAERRHIARELHDELGQVLSAIRLKLRTVSRQTGAPAQEAIEDCFSAVDRALTQVRALSLNLRPSVLDDFGLHAALEWYVGGQTEGAQLVGHFKSNLGDRRLPAPLETACFRVVQEAVTNVIRHAGARAFWVEVQHTGAQLSLRIRDDGAGFDAQAARDNASRGRSVGLLSMQERVELLGGQFQLESRRGSGTEIQARFALATSPQGGSDEEDLRVTCG